MKKFLIILILFGILITPTAYAQTADELKLISLLQQLIVLLQEQVRILTIQLQEQIQEQKIIKEVLIENKLLEPEPIVGSQSIDEEVDQWINTNGSKEQQDGYRKAYHQGTLEKFYQIECILSISSEPNHSIYSYIYSLEEYYQTRKQQLDGFNKEYIRNNNNSSVNVKQWSCKQVVNLRSK